MNVTLILSISSLVFCSIMAICAVTFIIYEFIYMKSRLTIFNGCCVSIFISKSIHLFCEYEIPLVGNPKMVEVYWKLGCFLMNSACYSPYIILLYFRTTCMFVLAKPWERQLIKYLSILGIIAFNVGSLGVFMPLNMEQYQTVYGISSIFASMFVFVNDIFYMVRFQRLLKISKNPPMASLKNDNNQVPRIIAQYGAVMIILQLVCLFNYIARVALQERLFDIPSNFCQVTGYTTLFAMKFKLDQIKSS